MTRFTTYKSELHWYRQILYPFIAAVIFSSYVPGLARAQQTLPQLNENIVVQGHLVRLGDLFVNAGRKGQTPVFRSPDLGTTGKISVKRILAAAKAQGFQIAKPPAFLMVTVSRASRLIDLEEFKSLIQGRLQDKFPHPDGEGQLVIRLSKNHKPLHVDPKIKGQLSLSSLDWSPRSGRFAARFLLEHSPPILIRGTANMMVKVAVARGNLASGKLLTENDMKMKFVKTGNRQQKYFNAIEKAVGMSVKRNLRSGKPIYVGDLHPPTLIHKNQLVTILLEVPGLVLRTEGKALADAVSGEAVKVLNTQSKRIIHATAVASGLVSVKLTRSIQSGS